MKPPSEQSVRLPIDGEWTLEDLYSFPRAFIQLYSWHYALVLPHREDEERRAWIFTAYPWRGGYSAVNFFRDLGSAVPRRDRPRLLAFRYASPGFVEIGLVVAAAMALNKTIHAFCSSVKELHDLYSHIYKEMRERQLMHIHVQRETIALDREALDFAEDATRRLGSLMGVERLEELATATGTPLGSLKILLAVYRRVRVLAEYQRKGKIHFDQ